MRGNIAKRIIAKRIGVVLVGYLAAAVASGFVVALMFLTLSSSRDMALDMGFGMILPAAINFVGVVAAIPAIAVIFIAEYGSIRSKWFYLLCGIVIGVSLPPMIVGRFDF